MSARFAVHTSSTMAPRGWVWVHVHDTAAELRQAAARYSPEEDHSDTAACFQGRDFRVHVDADGNVDEPADPYAGVMRLLPEHGVSTLAHECTHAAVAMFYRRVSTGLHLEDPMDLEEALCYAVGDLVGAITTQLQARGIWPGKPTEETQ